MRAPDGSVTNCKIRGVYRIKGIRATNPVAVGDRVEFTPLDEGNTGVITHIEERKNYIIRRSPNLSKEYQLVAANVDQAWLMVTLISPRTFPEFIDRFLVTAEAYSIPVSLLFNKTDLYNDALKAELAWFKKTYQEIGYPCYELSAIRHENTDLLRQEKWPGS